MPRRLLLLALALAGCSGPISSPAPQPKDDISFPVEDFTLTERSGVKKGRADLLGKVWIASFVFTRCTGPCPQITSTMARLQSELDLANQSDLRLVTFTVDPSRDDPAELRKYAEDLESATRDRWLFLTGDEKAIHGLLQKSFKVSAVRERQPKTGRRIHSQHRLGRQHDRQGNVRGFFHGMGEPAEIADSLKLKELVARLLKEEP